MIGIIELDGVRLVCDPDQIQDVTLGNEHVVLRKLEEDSVTNVVHGIERGRVIDILQALGWIEVRQEEWNVLGAEAFNGVINTNVLTRVSTPARIAP